MREICGKTVLITGAASGIGRATALRFAREGARVHLLDVDEAALHVAIHQVLDAGGECTAMVCDLAQPEHIDAAVHDACERCGHVDVLINNAGITYYGPTVHMTDEQWERLLAVNFLAPVRLTRRLLPVLLSRPEAHVVNVASMYALFATQRSLAYHATKYGLFGFSEALRAEFVRCGLGVTTLCPGYVRTNIYGSAMRHGGRKRPVPRPPGWVSTTPEKVADKTLLAVRRNRRLALVTPLAHLAYHAGRLFPGLMDFLYRLGPRKHCRTPVAEKPAPPLRLYAPEADDATRKAA